MADYNIKNVGKAFITRNSLRCDFTINKDAFMEKYSASIEELPSNAVQKLTNAISSKKDQKLGGKDVALFEIFFQKIQMEAAKAPADESRSSAAPSSSTTGFDSSEKSDAKSSEDMKSQDTDSKQITYVDKDKSGAGIETYDAKTGKKEGSITLKDGNSTGELVPLEIIEKVEAAYEFNGEKPKEDSLKTSGVFKITNVSEKNRIWDVDVSFKNTDKVDIEKELYYKSINPKKSIEQEYKVKEAAEPSLIIKELISTLNDEKTESYALSPTEANVVLFKLTVKNKEEYPLRDLKISKEIQQGYTDMKVVNTSIGSAEPKDGNIVWVIEKLEAQAEATLSINMTINIAGADVKARTGKVKAEYAADKAFTGLEVDKFDCYSDNFVGMSVEQEDEKPDMYSCSVIFENRSDYQVKIVNLDIKNIATGKKEVDIDPQDIPVLASGARWTSVAFETESKNDVEPSFQKMVEFFLMSDRKISSQGVITIEDLELAVAMLAGAAKYSVSQIESFREIPFTVLMEVKNKGGADLNELIMQDVIQSGYIPPKPEEIQLFVVRPSEDGEKEGKNDADSKEAEKVDWENLGEEISIDKSLIEIKPEDQDPTHEHALSINLKDLRSNPMGMFVPGMIIRAKYTVKAFKVAKDTEYVSNIKYIANTFPAGKPLEIVPDQVKIPVIHIRKKTIKGKEVRALPGEGQYEIAVFLENAGEFPLENIVIKDAIPANFEYTDFSIESTKTESQEGKDVLIWNVAKIEKGEKFEIKFKLTGRGDYKASDAQFSV